MEHMRQNLLLLLPLITLILLPDLVATTTTNVVFMRGTPATLTCKFNADSQPVGLNVITSSSSNTQTTSENIPTTPGSYPTEVSMTVTITGGYFDTTYSCAFGTDYTEDFVVDFMGVLVWTPKRLANSATATLTCVGDFVSTQTDVTWFNAAGSIVSGTEGNTFDSGQRFQITTLVTTVTDPGDVLYTCVFHHREVTAFSADLVSAVVTVPEITATVAGKEVRSGTSNVAITCTVTGLTVAPTFAWSVLGINAAGAPSLFGIANSGLSGDTASSTLSILIPLAQDATYTCEVTTDYGTSTHEAHVGVYEMALSGDGLQQGTAGTGTTCTLTNNAGTFVYQKQDGTTFGTNMQFTKVQNGGSVITGDMITTSAADQIVTCTVTGLTTPGTFSWGSITSDGTNFEINTEAALTGEAQKSVLTIKPAGFSTLGTTSTITCQFTSGIFPAAAPDEETFTVAVLQYSVVTTGANVPTGATNTPVTCTVSQVTAPPTITWSDGSNSISTGADYNVGSVSLSGNTATAVLNVVKASNTDATYTCLVTSAEWLKTDDPHTVTVTTTNK